MTWKPTEGQKLADAIVQQYANEMESALGFSICQMMRSRLFDSVAQAIDQALADGAELNALDKVVGNGHTSPYESFTPWPAFPDTVVQAEEGPRGGTSPPHKQFPMPLVKEEGQWPTRQPLPQDVGAPKDTIVLGGPLFTVDPLGLGDVQLVPMGVADAPKKRGRPPGPGKKKAAKAKRKSAKAIRAELYPVDAPPVEVAPVEVAAEPAP